MIVRKLKATEISILTNLFYYKDINDMIVENTRDIENGVVVMFLERNKTFKRKKIVI